MLAAIMLAAVALMVTGCTRIGSGSATEAARTATISITAVGDIVRPDSPTTAVAGGGSGFFISSDGLAVTTNHAVAGNERLEVSLGDDPRILPATVVAVSECDDLALIAVDVDGPVPFLDWDPDDPGPGTDVVALGVPVPTNAPAGSQSTAPTDSAEVRPGTVGATSSGQRLAPTLTAAATTFTHDARTLPGMAGGPIIGVDGQVVGVNLGAPPARVGGAPTDDSIAVAIAATTAQQVVDRLLGEPGPSLGMGTIAVAGTGGTPGGLWVSGVDPNSPAAQAGIRPGDVITAVDGTELDAPETTTGGFVATYCAAVNAADGGPVPVEVARPDTGLILSGTINGSAPLRVVATIEGRAQQRGDRTPTRLRGNERAEGGSPGSGSRFRSPVGGQSDGPDGSIGIPGLDPGSDGSVPLDGNTPADGNAPADGNIGNGAGGGNTGGSDMPPPPPPDSYTAYVQVIDTSGALTIEVPAVWLDINRGPGPTGLPFISASPDLAAFAGGYTTPGVAYFAIEAEASVTETLDVLSLQLADDCADAGRAPYADLTFTGAVQIWRDCAGQDMAVAVVVATAPEEPDLLFATVVHMVSDADIDAVERIFDSFDLTGN